MKPVYPLIISAAVILTMVVLASCGKSSPETPPPAQPSNCAGKNITIATTIMPSTGCSNDGSIAATASGSSGFTYKIGNTGSYQSSGSFTGLAAGSYTIFAKDSEGCEQTTTAVVAGGAAGPMFTQVRSLMAARCQSCHSNSVQNGGVNLAVDCNIVATQNRIKIRAVDQNNMPPNGPLSQAEKNIITNWINAGGRISD